jgi:hypothetical protein
LELIFGTHNIKISSNYERIKVIPPPPTQIIRIEEG